MQVAGDVEAVSRNQRHVSQLSLLLPIFVFLCVPYNVGLTVHVVPANIPDVNYDDYFLNLKQQHKKKKKKTCRHLI